MAPAFSKEAILRGSVDHLCLVCESYLKSERDVCLHVSTLAHRRNLDSTDYVDKYRTDRVREVKNWYFCEFCNVLVSTRTGVKLHVEEAKHEVNRSSQTIARVDEGIVLRNIVIEEEAWHGLIGDNTCALCNMEYENKDDHISESAHTLNLIRNKVSDVTSEDIYRKVDESNFQCLTCNEIVAEITAHLEDIKHKAILQGCIKTPSSKREESVKKGSYESCHDEVKINKTGIEDSRKYDMDIDENVDKVFDTNVGYITYNSGEKTSCNLCNCDVNVLDIQIHLDSSQHQHMVLRKANENSNIENNACSKQLHDVLEPMTKFQKDEIDIDCVAQTAACTSCSVKLEFDCKVIENHSEDHEEKLQQNDISPPAVFEMDKNNTTRYNSKRFTSVVSPNHEHAYREEFNIRPIKTVEQANGISDIQKRAEEHNLTYKPTSVSNINEHVNGQLHKNNVRTLKSPKPLDQNKSTMNTNVKMCNLPRVPTVQFIRVLGTFKINNQQDVLLNEKYCIKYYCFTFLTNTKKGNIRCQVCEVNLCRRDIEEHVQLGRHVRALMEVPVIISTDSEFIREIRSGIFQCGFCNIIGSWEEMENHLKSKVHIRNKNIANNRRTQYLLTTEVDCYEQTSCLRFMMLLHNLFN